MVTIALIFLFAFIAVAIWGYEKFKQDKSIANAIDENATDPNFLTLNSLDVIKHLKDPRTLKLEQYSNSIILPDGQKISYVTDTMEVFKKFSTLKYEPSPKEWLVLRGIVKKLISIK